MLSFAGRFPPWLRLAYLLTHHLVPFRLVLGRLPLPHVLPSQSTAAPSQELNSRKHAPSSPFSHGVTARSRRWDQIGTWARLQGIQMISIDNLRRKMFFRSPFLFFLRISPLLFWFLNYDCSILMDMPSSCNVVLALVFTWAVTRQMGLTVLGFS